MANRLEWQERFNIGVEVIDREHQKLFNILNKLFEYKKEVGKDRWVCQEGIKYFKDHAMKHFTEEEVYMASIDYAGFETHRRLHDNFRKNTLPALEKELRRTLYSTEAVNHFLSVCTGWLIGHTLTEDRAITDKTMSKWENLMPDEEQAAMRKTIIQLLYHLFELDAKVISECYGGEKFGKGIYYRLVYEDHNGKEWENLLVFEEKLIVNTIGNMIHSDSDTVNVMQMNTARYTARQFVECIKEHFPSADMDELKEENLLTYEQFQALFEKRNPQFSFLFDTGAGYFAYCAVAPHLLDGGPGIAIKSENAMTQVKKYLDKKEEKGKKKILVVDDAAVARKAMMELLGNDYEVALANSGMSAIRSIMLDRPDLVLLDYEMPVCDGGQVLEMIRSEEEFADIPVIFLTGSSNKENVKKLLALKPDGYLLKTQRPWEIKKGIKEYFLLGGWY